MNTGDSLERHLNAIHGYMEAQGLATVRKVPTPVKVTSRRGARVDDIPFAFPEWM